LWPCHPTNTLAFNRFAAGWIDDSQVQLQTGGTNTFTLDAPAGSGTEMVAAPDPSNAHVMLTLEARPKVGFDQFLGVEGVAVHMIDQRIVRQRHRANTNRVAHGVRERSDRSW